MTQEKKPLVTIVTITFNIIKAKREAFFRQCIESVHNQTYENIEHIVIDGASADGTIKLLKEYDEKKWIKYISEPDSGIYDAMNKGIKMAKGKYIAFLNSDDYYNNKDGILYSVESLEKSSADFSYSPVIMLRKNGKYIKTHPQCKPKISNIFFVMPFCHQTMLTKRSVMINEEMFDTNFKSAGDYDFVLRLCLKKYKSIFVNKKFVTFRLGGISDSNKNESIIEVSKLYFKNYNALLPIKKKDCDKIYCTDFDSSSLKYYPNLPLKLAKILKKFEPYFNYDEYLENRGFFKRIKRRIKKTFHINISIHIPKFFFVFFSPRDFLNKYKNMIFNSKLRQPIRKIWYAVRFKKIK